MANRLTQKQIDEMFDAYQEKPNCEYVSKKCGVSWNTANSYKISEGWDNRLAALREKMIEKVDAKIVTDATKHKAIAESVINLFARSLVGRVSQNCPKCGEIITISIPRPDIKPADFARMIELINEQLGGIDTTPRKHIVVLVRPNGEMRKENEDEM